MIKNVIMLSIIVSSVLLFRLGIAPIQYFIGQVFLV